MNKTNSLKNKIVLITGASRGIGKHLAIAMACEGAKLVITSRKFNQSPGQGGTLADTLSAIQMLGAEVLAVPATITEATGAKALIDQTIKNLAELIFLSTMLGFIRTRK